MRLRARAAVLLVTGMVGAGGSALLPGAPGAAAATKTVRSATSNGGNAGAAGAAPAGCTSAGCSPFVASGLDGGSYVVAVAADPFNPGVVLAGSDVGGVYRSTDFGAHWTNSDQGLTVGLLSVGSLVFSPTTPGRVYAALGNHGSGGVEESTNDGVSWSVRSSVPQFNGPNPYTDVRASGKMLAIAPDGTLYTSTTGAGVMRSTDDGATWTTIGMGVPSGSALRGLILDPSNPNTLYVANYGAGNANYPSGVYVSTNPEASQPSFSPVSGAPADVEDLSFVGSNLYVAASSGGVWSLAGPAGPWVPLLPPNTGLWASVTGYVPSGGTVPVLYAGAARAQRDPSGTGYQSVEKSSDGGVTWTSVTSGPSSNIHPHEGGPGGPVWWMAVSQPGLMLGGASYIPRELAVNPANPQQVIVAGNADVWSTSDAGTDWYPMVRGLSTTEERGVIADPNSPGTTYAIGYDWGLVGSQDWMRDVREAAPTNVTGALDIALDTATTPSTVYLAGFSEFSQATSSEVYVDPNPLGGATWTSLGLSALTHGQPILGVAANEVPVPGQNGSVPVVLAAVGGVPGIGCSSICGIWRKAGTRPWQQVQTTAMASPEGGFHASFGWLPGSQTAFLYDPATGLWRSTDAGSHWSLIWSVAFNHDLTGFVGVGAGSGTVYLSLGTWGLWKVSGAATGTQMGSGMSAAKLGTFYGAGPLTVASDGSVWLAQVAPYGTGLWRSLDGGATWTEVGDSSYYNMADFPTGISVTGPDAVFVSTRGDGVVMSS